MSGILLLSRGKPKDNNRASGERSKMAEIIMDKKEIKEVIEWCDEKGHSEHEILELIRRIVDAKPRKEDKKEKAD